MCSCLFHNTDSCSRSGTEQRECHKSVTFLGIVVVVPTLYCTGFLMRLEEILLPEFHVLLVIYSSIIEMDMCSVSSIKLCINILYQEASQSAPRGLATLVSKTFK